MTNHKKLASLKTLYQAMDSAEIEYRLKHGDISPIAREVAKSELQRRSAAYSSGVDSEAAKILIGAGIIVYGAYFYFSTEIKGDHLERGLTHVFLAVYTIGYVLLGSFFLMGAFFKGTDDELEDKLNECVGDMTEAVRRLH
ncbi:MAG: hypothetical protein EON54_05610 [Alcaligenaceae bacterium]|nr:MAG: hypothetical protein EON54_05610 [Alcaligenaceae bacterium]